MGVRACDMEIGVETSLVLTKENTYVFVLCEKKARWCGYNLYAKKII